MHAPLVGALLGALLAVAPLSAATAQGSAPAPGTAAAPRPASAADLRFLARMLGHHAQALTLAALVPTRTARADLRALAERIAVSQRDEMALMRRMLAVRGAPVGDGVAGDADGHAGHDAAPSGDPPAARDARGARDDMPGMLTPAALDTIAASRGRAFERRFLQGMIHHHEGAVAMVAELLATPGAAQAPDLFRFAADVDADQRAEIRRMRALLAALGAPARRSGPR